MDLSQSKLMTLYNITYLLLRSWLYGFLPSLMLPNNLSWPLQPRSGISPKMIAINQFPDQSLDFSDITSEV